MAVERIIKEIMFEQNKNLSEVQAKKKVLAFKKGPVTVSMRKKILTRLYDKPTMEKISSKLTLFVSKQKKRKEEEMEV